MGKRGNGESWGRESSPRGQLNIRISQELRERIQQQAKREERNVSDMARLILKRWFEERELTNITTNT